MRPWMGGDREQPQQDGSVEKSKKQEHRDQARKETHGKASNKPGKEGRATIQGTRKRPRQLLDKREPLNQTMGSYP